LEGQEELGEQQPQINFYQLPEEEDDFEKIEALC
jgi:hypothetical protein